MTSHKPPGGGGGSQPGTVIPVADTMGVTVDTTTYDDPIGSGKLTTLVFAEDQSAIAFAVEGDDFPRLIVPSDPTDAVYYLGDGTSDPTNGPHAAVVGHGTGGAPSFKMWGGPSGGTLELGSAPGPHRFFGGTLIENGLDFGSGSPRLSGGSGAPSGGGEVGDIYFRLDPSGANQTLYRCTVAGTPGNATWVGIL